MSFVLGNFFVMSCFLLQNKGRIISVEDVLPGSYYACKYDLCFCFANDISVELNIWMLM